MAAFLKAAAHPILASIMALTGGGCGMDEAGANYEQEAQAQRIAILTVATNIHAIRWINALAGRGLDLIVITQQPPLPGDYHPSVRFALLPFRGRLAYLLNALVLPAFSPGPAPRCCMSIMRAAMARPSGCRASATAWSPYGAGTSMMCRDAVRFIGGRFAGRWKKRH